jgi:hypothetical protein
MALRRAGPDDDLGEGYETAMERVTKAPLRALLRSATMSATSTATSAGRGRNFEGTRNAAGDYSCPRIGTPGRRLRKAHQAALHLGPCG